jgi:hypothetical protein
MQPEPQVSVIVPAYNYGRYLAACLASILDQPGVDVSVLVLDDASTDDTFAVAAAIAATDGRVEVRRHERNIGHIATYNEGLDWADGDYVVLISADDLLAPRALARAAALLDAHPEVGFVYGGVQRFRDDEPLPEPRDPDHPQWQVRTGRDWIVSRCRSGENAIVSPEVMVRRTLQNEVGGYRADLPHTGDLEMWLRMAARAHVGRLPDADLAYHRQHPRSMQRSVFPSFVASAVQRRDAFDVFFAQHGRVVPGAPRLHRLVRRALAFAALCWAVLPARQRETSDDRRSLVRFAGECVSATAGPARWLGLAAAVASGAPRAAAIALLARRNLAAVPAGALLRRAGIMPRWRAVADNRAAAPGKTHALGGSH